MATVRISGRCIAAGEVRTVGKGFQICELVFDEGGDKPSPLQVQFGGKKNIEVADRIRVGDHVTIECKLRGSESSKQQGRYFTNLDFAELIQSAVPAPRKQSPTPEPERAAPQEEKTNLPF